MSLLNSELLDPFDTDGALGANWSPRPIVAGVTHTTGPIISGGIAVSPTVGSDRWEAWWNAEQFSDAHEVWGVVRPGREHLRLYLCLGNPGVDGETNGYVLDYDFSSGTDGLIFSRIDSEVETVLDPDLLQEVADGDLLCLARTDPETVAVGYRPVGSEVTSALSSVADATYQSGYLGMGVEWASGTDSPGFYEIGGGNAPPDEPNAKIKVGAEFVDAFLRIKGA